MASFDDTHVVHMLLKSCFEDAVRMKRIFAIVNDFVPTIDDYLEEIDRLEDSLEWKTAEYRRLQSNRALLNNQGHIEDVLQREESDFRRHQDLLAAQKVLRGERCAKFRAEENEYTAYDNFATLDTTGDALNAVMAIIPTQSLPRLVFPERPVSLHMPTTQSHPRPRSLPSPESLAARREVFKHTIAFKYLIDAQCANSNEKVSLIDRKQEAQEHHMDLKEELEALAEHDCVVDEEFFRFENDPSLDNDEDEFRATWRRCNNELVRRSDLQKKHIARAGVAHAQRHERKTRIDAAFQDMFADATIDHAYNGLHPSWDTHRSSRVS